MHKIVREHIDMNSILNFERNHDPLKNMGVGRIAQIDMFMDKIGLSPDRYIIQDDFSIDVNRDVNLTNQNLEELPYYINFGTIYGGFYAGGNPWKSLKGFPEEVNGDLQINSISNFIPEDIDPGITKKLIKKLIKVHGKIWI
jgi:hypothetical protein